MNKTYSQYNLILLTSLFFVIFHNNIFFLNTLNIYEGLENIPFVFSLSIVLFSLITILLTLVSSKYSTKFLLCLTLIISSICVYFMNTYNVIIDDMMIQNILQTNLQESMDLFNFKQVLYVFFLGVVPSYFIYKAKVSYKKSSKEFLSKIKFISLFSLIIIITIFAFSKHYTSFFRENKPLRYYTMPTYWIYSVGNYINKTFSSKLEFKTIANDAFIKDRQKRKLIILVVGEAARADHLSLNNYKRETNPFLKKQNIINFSNMSSCGTSTAVSVPCMFSVYNQSEYTYKKGISTENVLDILNKTNKVDILWKDNNSDSKGVALRIPYIDIKNDPSCKEECRDQLMLKNLDKFVQNSKKQNILIVLHQMGNHGPSYFKRYPKNFEKFTPVCKTNQLEECSKEEIINAYDNALLYTDYFLSETIDFLKSFSKEFETGMIYLSDHGESLGEKGIYLHGMPYFIAPKNQKHIASFMWFNNDNLISKSKLEAIKDKEFSHNNLFHSLLGLFEVQTKVYKKQEDIFKDAKAL